MQRADSASDLRHDRHVGQRDGVREPSLSGRCMHRSLHAGRNSVLRQRRTDVHRDRHMGNRGRVREPSLRRRWMHGVCAPSTTRCSGNGVQTCSATGTWGTAVACAGQACVNGTCGGVCAPGATQCSGNGVQTCSATGTWGTAVACASQACINGGCSGVCTPGATQCSGNSVQTCGANGTLGAPVACVNQACVNGACTGTCTPGAATCSGNSRQTCGTNGTFGAATPCTGQTCASGACTGVCSPGATQCSGNAVQTCTTGGIFGTPVPCTNQACLAGACTGVCTPGATQCSGNGVQTCSSSGAWGTAAPCTNQTCSNGACVGTCAPGAAQCSGNSTQTCTSNGTFGNTVACTNKTCSLGACVGSCAPGQTSCSGNNLLSCGATGTFGGSTPCVNKTCVTNACVGVCAPNQTQCSGNGVQTCTANGTFGTAVACTGGQTCAGGQCVCPAATPMSCNGACIDPLSDKNNCGTCGTVCPISCSAGTCLRATGVVAGLASSACAVISDGTVRCWGQNFFGELGIGTSFQQTSAAPTPSPTAVHNLSKATFVGMGYGNACAIVTGGALRCWGDNQSGELGNGTVGNSLSFLVANPVPTLTSGVTAVGSSGGGSTGFITCAVVSGAVDCWGITGFGEAGDMAVVNGSQSTPSRIALPGTASSLGVGPVTACAVVSGGTVSCWGSNSLGQLANGTTRRNDERGHGGAGPERRGSHRRFGGAPSHVRAARVDGNRRLLGRNLNGQCGSGTVGGDNIVTPNFLVTATPVVGLPGPVQAIAAGSDHTCARLTSGAITCWGSDSNGELGNQLSQNSQPVPQTTGVTATAVAAGAGFTCALLASGTVSCWGSNTSGELGRGSTSTAPGMVPTSVKW